TEVSENGEVRYSLDDYMEMESALNGAKPKEKETKVIEEELQFEKKVTEDTEEVPEVYNSKDDDIDPINNSIDESLKKRANERRKKLKDFNYKFRNNLNKIDEIEKQPAYKRMGIELEDKKNDNASRMSLGTDSNDEIQLRSNNSFLHDNVD